jgi:chromosome segregation protein
VLDEVDAALDEANIDRFCGLLKEFMSSTQFIVITHSKRTMTIADTLHGVTMQESGVSKRVSVRFEDVGEDGRIRASALRNEASAAGDEPSRKAA